MPSVPPSTREDVLKTGEVDPEFLAVRGDAPVSVRSEVTVEAVKAVVQASIPRRQKALEDTRPSTLNETTHHIPVRDGWESRTIRCCPATPAPDPAPLIVLLFGGGHCLGFPELELELARRLALAHNAVVFLPSYRLAPEHPFPYSIHDSWDVIQQLAEASSNSRGPDSLVPPFCDPTAGFIIGGTSAGANLSASIAHLARDLPLKPPLTGQFLSCGVYISPQHVPSKYKTLYLSYDQNADAPMLGRDLFLKFRNAHKCDFQSPLWASFDQSHPEDEEGEVKRGHMGLPPTYFQACGADLGRDDTLIYERVLREECGVNTRLDLYAGWPHCWWSVFPKAEKSLERETDTIEGVRWLLDLHREQVKKDP